jgi:hypothetical protein
LVALLDVGDFSRLDDLMSVPGVMSKKREKSVVSHRADGCVRSLQESEVKELERALGKPIDRGYLVLWVSPAIGDCVRLSTQPTPREARDELLKIAGEGREWINRIHGFSGSFLLGELSELTTTVTRFCVRADSAAERLKPLIKAGRPRIPFPLEGFLQNMIGIAKRAKVLPSTPGRAARKTTGRDVRSSFLEFVQTALAVSRDVIKSSPMSDGQKQAALSILRVQSEDALIKILEDLRGRIGDYRETPRGLVEWNAD